MKKLTVAVTEQPEFSVFGMSIQTDMAKAGVDCPQLWLTFMESAASRCQGQPRNTFGVSSAMDPASGAFTYHAAMEWVAGETVPKGMEGLRLLGGNYATCQPASLASIAEAYTHLFAVWLPSSGYVFDQGRPCYEHYPPDYQENHAFSIYLPVLTG